MYFIIRNISSSSYGYSIVKLINLLTGAGTTTTGDTRGGCGSRCSKVTSSSLCAGR